MGTTLISFIGTGRKKINGEYYDRTEYDFGKKHISTSVFFNAILQSNKYSISEAIIIGTKTSSWSALLEDNLADEQNENLYLEIEECIESGGIDNKLVNRLGNILSTVWNIKIKCVTTISHINRESAFNVISRYFSECSSVKNKNLLLDITHGFRTMPVLLMSALHLNESIISNLDSISLIYGEYDGGKSYVRELDAIWKSVEISRAVSSFFQKFDSTELSSLLEPFWKSGAKALDSLGNSLQGNLLIWLDEQIKQLKNALNEDINEPPLWFFPVKQKINKLYNELSKNRSNYQLSLCVARLFAERRIYGQAIIALQLAFEAFILEYNGVGKEYYGDFDKTKALYKRFISMKELSKKDKEKLWALNNTRNTVAHGGSRSTHGGKPQAQNLPGQYEAYEKMLKKVVSTFG